eukprot:jgi/Mesvir1/24541/Mv21875-RA.1
MADAGRANRGDQGADAVAARVFDTALTVLESICCVPARGYRIPEDPAMAKLLYAVLRAVASALSPGSKFSMSSLGRLLHALNKLFVYGCYSGPMAAEPIVRGSTAFPLPSSSPQPPPSGAGPTAKAPYRPPHRRGGASSQREKPLNPPTSSHAIDTQPGGPSQPAGPAQPTSDSDVSDSDSCSDAGLWDRDRLTRVRILALQTVPLLAKADPRSLHAHWELLLPSQVGGDPLQPRPYVPSLLTPLLHDPDPRTRAAAAAALTATLDRPAKKYLMVAQWKGAVAPWKGAAGGVGRDPAQSFAALSHRLGWACVQLHRGLLAAIEHKGGLAATQPQPGCAPCTGHAHGPNISTGPGPIFGMGPGPSLSTGSGPSSSMGPGSLAAFGPGSVAGPGLAGTFHALATLAGACPYDRLPEDLLPSVLRAVFSWLCANSCGGALGPHANAGGGGLGPHANSGGEGFGGQHGGDNGNPAAMEGHAGSAINSHAWDDLAACRVAAVMCVTAAVEALPRGAVARVLPLLAPLTTPSAALTPITRTRDGMMAAAATMTPITMPSATTAPVRTAVCGPSAARSGVEMSNCDLKGGHGKDGEMLSKGGDAKGGEMSPAGLSGAMCHVGSGIGIPKSSSVEGGAVGGTEDGNTGPYLVPFLLSLASAQGEPALLRLESLLALKAVATASASVGASVASASAPMVTLASAGAGEGMEIKARDACTQAGDANTGAMGGGASRGTQMWQGGRGESGGGRGRGGEEGERASSRCMQPGMRGASAGACSLDSAAAVSAAPAPAHAHAHSPLTGLGGGAGGVAEKLAVHALRLFGECARTGDALHLGGGGGGDDDGGHGGGGGNGNMVALSLAGPAVNDVNCSEPSLAQARRPSRGAQGWGLRAGAGTDGADVRSGSACPVSTQPLRADMGKEAVLCGLDDGITEMMGSESREDDGVAALRDAWTVAATRVLPCALAHSTSPAIVSAALLVMALVPRRAFSGLQGDVRQWFLQAALEAGEFVTLPSGSPHGGGLEAGGASSSSSSLQSRPPGDDGIKGGQHASSIHGGSEPTAGDSSAGVGGSAAVQAAVCRLLGVLVCPPFAELLDAESTRGVTAILANSLQQRTLHVRMSAAWALANLCDTFSALSHGACQHMRPRSGGHTQPSPHGSAAVTTPAAAAAPGYVPAWALSALVTCALRAADDNDKVRAHAVRALGNLAKFVDFGSFPADLASFPASCQ